MFIEDPGAERRSLMLKKPFICNGALTGHQCEHYWLRFAPIVANNPDNLKDGERGRACLLSDAFLPEFDSKDTPTFCNRYEPRKAPGLVNIARRAFGAMGIGKGGYVGFDKAHEVYSSLSPEEIREMQAADPSTPDEYFPPALGISVADIARVQTANMGPAPAPKPGEISPEEVDAVLATLTEKAPEQKEEKQ